MLPTLALADIEPSQVGTIVGTLMDALIPHLDGVATVGLAKHEGTLGEREGYPDYRHAELALRVELKLIFVDNPDIPMKKPPTPREPSARLTQKVTVKNVVPETDAMLVIAYRLEEATNQPDAVTPTIEEAGPSPGHDHLRAQGRRGEGLQRRHELRQAQANPAYRACGIPTAARQHRARSLHDVGAEVLEQQLVHSLRPSAQLGRCGAAVLVARNELPEGAVIVAVEDRTPARASPGRYRDGGKSGARGTSGLRARPCTTAAVRDSTDCDGVGTAQVRPALPFRARSRNGGIWVQIILGPAG